MNKNTFVTIMALKVTDENFQGCDLLRWDKEMTIAIGEHALDVQIL